MQRTKISHLRELMAAGRWDEALSLANKFSRLGDEAPAIRRAHAANRHPGLYRQMKHDPVQLRAAGIQALQRRYGR